MDQHDYHLLYDDLFGIDPRLVYTTFGENFPCNCSLIQTSQPRELEGDKLHIDRQNDSLVEISELMFEIDGNITWRMHHSVRLIFLLVIVGIIVSAIMVLSYVACTFRVTQNARISLAGENMERATSTHGWLKTSSFESRIPNQYGIKSSGSTGLIAYYHERNSGSFTLEPSTKSHQTSHGNIFL